MACSIIEQKYKHIFKSCQPYGAPQDSPAKTESEPVPPSQPSPPSPPCPEPSAASSAATTPDAGAVSSAGDLLDLKAWRQKKITHGDPH